MSTQKQPQAPVRIAAVWEKDGLLNELIYNGFCRRASLYPEVILRRFDGLRPRFKATILQEIAHWQPSAVAANLSDLNRMTLLRRQFRTLPIVSACNMPATVANSVVAGSAPELVHIVCDFLRIQGLTTLACFCTNNAHPAEQDLSVFHAEVPGGPSLAHDIPMEALLDEPRGAAKRIVGKWLASLPKPTGIMVLDTHGGPYLARLCRQLGLQVPQDIQIVCTDEADECIGCHPRLTSVQTPWNRIGDRMMETLLQHLKNPSQPPPRLIPVLGSTIIPRESTGSAQATNAGVSKALSLIQTVATSGTTAQELHRQSTRGSRSTFYRQFRKLTGKTPASLLRQTRLQEACRLLKDTSDPITRIAESCGFTSPNYFTQVFTREMKMSPSAFRRGTTRPTSGST